ncbi:hypothetical protein THASP1DRAFT_30596 [Thamnocephalis sphaerospora]|uniref:Uncharacterized protein n=1 Tax=Thamnocephalis sphaerospora TaxID=78915 RepID=A0A4P9XNM8_9FUNG|nr:hypothetical protein THASP1DRAFT_30596 [Thamnocephalis sphaerospora]|eukprot:RKP07587.1 hypothetical protein THASP1DRAFT_30596 [Thamnocephalis sphaerospora]
MYRATAFLLAIIGLAAVAGAFPVGTAGSVHTTNTDGSLMRRDSTVTASGVSDNPIVVRRAPHENHNSHANSSKRRSLDSHHTANQPQLARRAPHSDYERVNRNIKRRAPQEMHAHDRGTIGEKH